MGAAAERIEKRVGHAVSRGIPGLRIETGGTQFRGWMDPRSQRRDLGHPMTVASTGPW